MKSLIHDFGSSIFSSHCHTCILACCCHLCYSNPSILKLDDRTILSQEGPYQGDPLGSILFCVSIHPDLLRLQSELVAGFMDDLTLGGPSDVVAADLDYISSIQDGTEL